MVSARLAVRGPTLAVVASAMPWCRLARIALTDRDRDRAVAQGPAASASDPYAVSSLWRHRRGRLWTNRQAERPRNTDLQICRLEEGRLGRRLHMWRGPLRLPE